MSSSPAHPVAFIYRLVFHYIEPLFALGGVVLALTRPEDLIRMTTPSVRYTPSQNSLDPLLLQIVGGWMVLIFNDLITLRVYDRDVRIWKLIIGAHTLSDISYILAIHTGIGPATFWNPSAWDSELAMTIVTTLLPFFLKLSLLSGIGVRTAPQDRPKSKAA